MSSENGDLTGQHILSPIMFTDQGLTLFDDTKRNKTIIDLARLAAILDKTVEKILYLDNIFLNIVAVPVPPSPPSPESNVVVYSKESLIPGRL